MKYGENFERESVPGWSLRMSSCASQVTNTIAERMLTPPSPIDLDNIDYNSLKHFIKVHTTRDEAKAIAIPGQPDTHLAKVEDELYHELCAQHGRAGLFVTAKADEINRRLRTRSPSLPLDSSRLHGRCVILWSLCSCIYEWLADES